MPTRALLLALLALAGALLATPARASALAPCDKYASTAGSDTIADGSERFPYLTVGKLMANLDAGNTGCLVGPGTFTESGPVTFSKPDLTLRSQDPDGRATIVGQVVIPTAAPRATLTALTIDGSTLSSTQIVIVRGSDAHIVGNEIRSNGQLVCVYAGPDSSGRAAGLLVEGNLIHKCESGVGLVGTRGAHVVDNTIYRQNQSNSAGVRLSPDADSSTIEHNTIVNNFQGVRFAGDDSATSDSDHVERNVITNSNPVDPDGGGNITFFWMGPIGMGNVADANCLDGGDSANPGNVPNSHPGFTMPGFHSVGDPKYLNLTADTYTLQNGSGCAGYGVLPGTATGAAVGVDSRRAILTGTVNPHFQTANWHFEYGPGASLATDTPLAPIGDARSVPTDVSAAVGLAPATTYSYRLVASNPSGGTRAGATRTLTTPPEPTPTPGPTPVSTPVPNPDPDGDHLVAPQDHCPDLNAGKFDTNHNGCPGPMRHVRASDIVPVTQRGHLAGKLVSLRVRFIDLRTERGARVTVRCKGKGRACKQFKLSAKARRNGRLRISKGLPRTIAPRSVLLVRVTKAGRAGAAFELRFRIRSVGWRVARERCIPIGSSTPAPLSTCAERTS
jgi:Right handed beta helix region